MENTKVYLYVCYACKTATPMKTGFTIERKLWCTGCATYTRHVREDRYRDPNAPKGPCIEITAESLSEAYRLDPTMTADDISNAVIFSLFTSIPRKPGDNAGTVFIVTESIKFWNEKYGCTVAVYPVR